MNYLYNYNPMDRLKTFTAMSKFRRQQISGHLSAEELMAIRAQGERELAPQTTEGLNMANVTDIYHNDPVPINNDQAINQMEYTREREMVESEQLSIAGVDQSLSYSIRIDPRIKSDLFKVMNEVLSNQSMFFSSKVKHSKSLISKSLLLK